MMGPGFIMPVHGGAASILLVIAGLALLVAGRRLFWLFVGLAGFAVGFQTAAVIMGPQMPGILLVAGAVCGIIGALVAIFFQRVAIAAGGFVAGSAIAVQLLQVMGDRPVEILVLAGGIVGAIALFLLFDWALIVLSAMGGAALIVQVLHLHMAVSPLLFLLLSLAGIAVQAGWLLAGRRRRAD